MCKNVVNDNFASDYFVGVSCCDPSRFDFASTVEIWGKADKLLEQKPLLSKANHDQLQLLYGVTYNPSGVLWDMPLRRWVVGACNREAMGAIPCASGRPGVYTVTLQRCLVS